MTKYLLIFIFLFGFVACETEQHDHSENASVSRNNFEEVARFSEGLFEPDEFIAIDDSFLVGVDRSSADMGLFRLDLSTGDICCQTGVGEAPGEIAGQGQAVLQRVNDEHIWLWDEGSRSITLYDYNLTPIERTSRIGDRGSLRAVPIDSTHVVNVTSTADPFAEILGYSDIFSGKGEPVQSVALPEEFSYVRNAFQLQYGHTVGDSEHAYIGFDFSSYIVGVNEEGIQFLTNSPKNEPMPPQEEPRLPDLAEYPRTTLAMDVDSEHLFVLYSGKQTSREEVMTYQREDKLGALSEELNRSNIILLYDKQDGSHVDTWNIPVQADDIALTEAYLYILSTDDMEPTIIQYERP